jgi:formylglycine-generating enzyme required for sulfatase activity
MSKKTRFWARVTLVLVIIVGVLELIAQGLAVGGGDVGLVAPDEALGWRLSPNHVGQMAGVTVSTDSHGVRVADADTPTERGQAGTVVWLLGDSFTFGWGLPWEETVSAQLAGLMPKGSAVYNLGVPGYGLTQSLLRLREERSLPDPDIVILLANPMDVVEDMLSSSLVYERPSPLCATEADGDCEVDTPSMITWALWTHSALYRTVRFMLESSLHSGTMIPGGDGLETALRAFETATEARSAVLLPVLHAPPLWDGFREMLESEGAERWFDITRMLRVRAKGERITISDRVHWNAQASADVARLLRAQLGRHLEITRGPVGCSGWECSQSKNGQWTRTRTLRNAAGEPMTLTQRFIPAGPGVMGSEEADLVAATTSIQSVYGAEGTRDFFVNETPPQVVHLDGFWIDLTEVTRAAFSWSRGAEPPTVAEQRGYEQAYRGRGAFDSRQGGSWRTPTWPEPLPGNAGTLPVTSVTWREARAHCQTMGLDLPTGAQWERAARGPTGQRYPWGHAEPTCGLANAGYFPKEDFCEKRPITVGSRPDGQSPYGVLDMAGNVWEWVRDCRTDRYDWMDDVTAWIGLPDNPEPPESAWSDGCSSRILRGGSWAFGYDAYMRPAARAFESGETMAEWSLGFRCAGQDGG